MSFDFTWYTQHPMEQKEPQSLDIPHDKLTAICNNAGKTNTELRDEAVSRADQASFQLVNPWFNRTTTNFKIVNNWLSQKGIRNPLYADFADAVETLAKMGLLSIDEAGFAQYLDGYVPTKLKGVTGREYDSLDSMIAQEREASLKTPIVDQSDIFEGHDIDDVKARLKQAEQDAKAIDNSKESTLNADAWLTLHPEFRDDTTNGKMLLSQLLLDGVSGVATIDSCERAYQKLVTAGLVRQNLAQLRKQQEAAVLERARAAAKAPGSAFDNTSEDDMYNLSMDELRRRAGAQMGN